MSKDSNDGAPEPRADVQALPKWGATTAELSPDQQKSTSATLPFDEADVAAANATSPPNAAASPWAEEAHDRADKGDGHTAAAHMPMNRPSPAMPLPEPPTPQLPRRQTTSWEPEPAPRRSEEILALLWYAAGHVERIRSNTHWSNVLDTADDESVDQPIGTDPEREDRRDVVEVLRRAAPCDAIMLREKLAFDACVDVEPPVMLFAGELAMGYDPAHELRVKIDIARALAPDDESVAAAAARGETLLGAESLVGSSLADEIGKRLESALRHAMSHLPADYLSLETRRAVVLGRHYEQRQLFGGPQLVSNLQLEHERSAMVCYLSVELADILPLYSSLPVRMIAELHPRLDNYSPGALALRCVALAWRPPTMSV